MSNISARARFIELRGEASPIALTPWVAVGSPIEEPLRILKISNNTDQNIIISTDAATEMEFVAANGFSLWDLGANQDWQASTLQFARGTQFYVKAATAPTTTGDVIITGIYAGV